ncbi:protease inhibitor I42 family protein [Chloroflexota bacterium]
MRKLMILATVVVACLLAGCVGEVETYTDSGRAINTSINQEFVIALGSNPTTGYSWQASYDQSRLELIGGESTYQARKDEQGTVGAGGIEYFRFKSLKAGEAELTMVYKRPWEEEILERKVFTVNVG